MSSEMPQLEIAEASGRLSTREKTATVVPSYSTGANSAKAIIVDSFATWIGHEASALGKSYVVALLLTDGMIAHSMKNLNGRSGLKTKHYDEMCSW